VRPPFLFRSFVTPSSPIACEHLASIDSTNAELLRRVAAQSIHATAISADMQSAGRGQRGRRWHAAAGDALLLSVGWEFDATIRLDGLSLAVGVAVARAAQRFAAGRVTLKWPNDLLLDDRAKLGGVLIETVPNLRGEINTRAAIIGIGINIRPPQREAWDRVLARQALPAAALLSTLQPREADGAPIVCEALKQTLLTELAHTLPEFATHGFAAFKDEWWSRRAYSEKRVQLFTAEDASLSQRAIHGKIADVAENGALIIDDGHTLHTLHSNSLSLRPIE
jgi:BirA family transcriptional regulator, biotin operon repressor / biotin---[acetyl-CoA-carboxylase] ligase